MSKIEDTVCEKLQQRAKFGLEKYGVSLERQDLTELNWLTHAQEEAMDLANYLEVLIQRKIAMNDLIENVKQQTEYTIRNQNENK
jgi:ABC-type transporter Mla maintaining outer membrane lipid asymmetry ATPase subunit MlaF